MSNRFDLIKQFVILHCKYGGFQKKVIDYVTSDINMKEYEKVFTHKSYDPENNYDGATEYV